jgi:regulator of sigma E protease
MSGVFGSVWWLLVSLGVLVTFHEFGHFWVARRCGVKVLRFSIGFGKPLWRWHGRDGTEYVIAAIPLGGYVRMLDEREGQVPPEQYPLAFNRKPVWQRIAIVAAGPLANLLLAFVLLWGMLVIGRPDYAPVVGQANALAAEAGLQPGDRILQIGDRRTPTWSEMLTALTAASLERQPIPITLQREDGQTLQRTLPLQRLPNSTNPRKTLAAIGIVPRHRLIPAIVGTVREGSPAWGKLAEGDRITAIDAHPVTTFEDIGPLVQAWGQRGGPGMVEVERDGERLALELTPQRVAGANGAPTWILGITNAPPGTPPHDAVLRLPPLAAIPAAWQETVYQIRLLVQVLAHALSGEVAPRDTLSGPITIARAANDFAAYGPAWFLEFLAMLSVSIGILNLLPIPILDGGHLLYYLIELVIRRPLGERVMAVGQYIGLAVLAGLMGLAFYNDILHLMS